VGLLLIIATVPLNTSSDDLDIDFRGYAYIDGVAVDSGFQIDVYNVDSDRSDVVETDEDGYFSEDIGDYADLGDTLQITPISGTNLNDYYSEVIITQTTIDRGYIDYDLKMSSVLDVDNDVFWLGHAHNNNYTWRIVNLNYSQIHPYDQETYSYGDFSIGFSWASHLNEIFKIGEGNPVWAVENITYTGEETYKMKVLQLSVTGQSEGWSKEWVGNGTHNQPMEHEWTFILGSDIHEDPGPRFLIDDGEFFQGQQWTAACYYKIKITLSWMCIVEAAGSPIYSSSYIENTHSTILWVKPV